MDQLLPLRLLVSYLQSLDWWLILRWNFLLCLTVSFFGSCGYFLGVVISFILNFICYWHLLVPLSLHLHRASLLLFLIFWISLSLSWRFILYYNLSFIYSSFFYLFYIFWTSFSGSSGGHSLGSFIFPWTLSSRSTSPENSCKTWIANVNS